MANPTPAHVSRVAKDYAPYGWSYKTNVVVNFGTRSATIEGLPILYAEDTDLVIEKIAIAAQTEVAAHPSNFWSGSFKTSTTSGAVVTVATFTTDSGESDAVAIPGDGDFLGLTTTESIVPWHTLGGFSLILDLTKDASAANIVEFTVYVRYRRKA
jgi:hypothetical protein